ncbi:MAG TPA: hypothetical protein VG126_05295 [Thermoleophilaceae bacterium]|nr:hypothetical protein [Thermoleophilaceae bacterium]
MSGFEGRYAAPARWLRRYGRAELLALAGSLAGYAVLQVATGSHAAAAYGAALGDGVAYYGFLLARDIAGQVAGARRASERLRAVGRSLRAMTCEFGPAELLDSTVVRPACTAIATAWLGTAAGVVVAKVVADVVFYVPVICTYELRRHRAGRLEAHVAEAEPGAASGA